MRHASAKEMHDDAKRLLARLEAGDTSEPDAASPATASTVAAPAKIPSEQSRMEMQDLLRDRLKKHGYRVLIFNEPQRALKRIVDADQKVCDCVLFSATDLGEAALEGFNEFGTHEATKDLPAILFVDAKQSNLVKRAELGSHRVLLTMPLKMRELRDTLLALLKPVNQTSAVG